MTSLEDKRRKWLGPFAERLHIDARGYDRLTVEEVDHYIDYLKRADEAERREVERLKQPQR